MKSNTFSTNREAILELLGDKLLSAYSSSVRMTQEWILRFKSTLPELAEPLDARGWANIIHDWLWTLLKAEVDQMQEVEIVEEIQTRELRAHKCVRIRVKKIRGGAVSSYPTPTALSFYEQDQLLLFEDKDYDGLMETNLVFGYEWDPDLESIVAATVSYPQNMRRALWVHRLAMEQEAVDDQAQQPAALGVSGSLPTEKERRAF